VLIDFQERGIEREMSRTEIMMSAARIMFGIRLYKECSLSIGPIPSCALNKSKLNEWLFEHGASQRG
jgi:hypothetical protein